MAIAKVDIKSLRIEMGDGEYFEASPELIRSFELAWLRNGRCEITITFEAPAINFGARTDDDENPILEGQMGFLKGPTIVESHMQLMPPDRWHYQDPDV